MLNEENNIVPSEQAAPHAWGSGSRRGKAPNLERLNSCVYWLGDGIYPSYACFVKTFPHPTTRMQKMFASAQERVFIFLRLVVACGIDLPCFTT